MVAETRKGRPKPTATVLPGESVQACAASGGKTSADKKHRRPNLVLGVPYPAPSDQTRSRTMSRIRSRNTGLELRLRRALWAAGLRYRLTTAGLPVHPDVVFPKAKVAVFCDSSFWHGRDPAKVERIRTNQLYWRARIARNVARDQFANESLAALGWLVLRYWDEELTSDLDACVTAVRRAVQERRQ